MGGMSNPVWVYDFTYNAKGDDPEHALLPDIDTFVEAITPLFKKWTFQKEQAPETGRHHFQGRGSLIKRKRRGELIQLLNAIDLLKGMEVRETVTANCTNAFYVMKYDTRVEGPWSDETYDKPSYIPRQYRGLLEKLHPYQNDILNSRDFFTDRGVNLVYDRTGNKGKSTIASLAELHYRAIDLPPLNDHKELLQVVCDILMAKKERDPQLVFIDLPRSMTEGDGLKKLAPFMVAIEQIKKGHVCDVRHHYKHWWFDSPQVWMFCNAKLDIKYLSRDRWLLHTISENRELVVLSHEEYEALE